jgi:hypothetical protein
MQCYAPVGQRFMTRLFIITHAAAAGLHFMATTFVGVKCRRLKIQQLPPFQKADFLRAN